MTRDQRAGALAQYIRDNLVIDEQASLAPDTALVKDGFIDSMGVVMLAAFLEERFGVQVAEDEILDHDSIDAILDLVDARR